MLFGVGLQKSALAPHTPGKQKLMIDHDYAFPSPSITILCKFQYWPKTTFRSGTKTQISYVLTCCIDMCFICPLYGLLLFSSVT